MEAIERGIERGIETPRPPLELVVRGTPDVVIAYACGKCGCVRRSEEEACRCCDPRCKCGAPVGGAWMSCDACCSRDKAARDSSKMEHDLSALRAARRVPTEAWAGAIYIEGYPGGREDYYPSIADLLDACALKEVEPPAWVWATTTTTLKLDARGLLEAALEEHHEDAWDQVAEVDELQEALNAWVAKHSSVETWWWDSGVAVVLDAARVDALLASGGVEVADAHEA